MRLRLPVLCGGVLRRQITLPSAKSMLALYEYWKQADWVPKTLVQTGVLRLPTSSSTILSVLPDLPREDEASLERRLRVTGTLAVVGASKIGKSFVTRKLVDRVRAEESPKGVEIAPRFDGIGVEQSSAIQRAQYPAAYYLSLRSLPLRADDIAPELVLRLTSMECPIKALPMKTFQGHLWTVLRRFQQSTRRPPFFIIDDVQYLFAPETDPEVRKGLADLVQMLHEEAGEGRLRLLLVMSSDVTDQLKSWSGMSSRLRIFRQRFVSAEDLRKCLLAAHPGTMTPEEASLIVASVGGHIGDIEEVLEARPDVATWKDAVEVVVAAAASSMAKHLREAPQRNLAWLLLKHMCDYGGVNLDMAMEQLQEQPEPLQAAMARLVADNLARKQGDQLFEPYRPAQRTAWPRVEARPGVSLLIKDVSALKDCL